MSTSVTDAKSILDFSWPEVKDSSFQVLPFNHDPSTYAEILKKLIKLFINFMTKYVQKNKPVDKEVVKAFLKRMAYIWGYFSHSVLKAAPDWIDPSQFFDVAWEDRDRTVIIPVMSPEDSAKMTEAINNQFFSEFSSKFYNILLDRKNKFNVYDHTVMHDLNKLISIVLLGKYEPHGKKFSQVGHNVFSVYADISVENMPIPLFDRLADFIIQHPEHPELSSKLNDSVDDAVDRVVGEASQKWKAAAAAKNEEAADSTVSIEGGRRTKRHKKRSGKSSGKRSGHKKHSKKQHRSNKRRSGSRRH